MAIDVNIVWINKNRKQQRPINIDMASEIFEDVDITTDTFWEEVSKEKPGSYEIHEHLMINVPQRTIEMDGEALRYDWFSIKEKLLKLRKAKWHVVQLDPKVIEEYPWLKEDRIEEKYSKGQGWHDENKRHSVTSKVSKIRKKYKDYNQNLRDDYDEGEPYGYY